MNELSRFQYLHRFIGFSVTEKESISVFWFLPMSRHFRCFNDLDGTMPRSRGTGEICYAGGFFSCLVVFVVLSMEKKNSFSYLVIYVTSKHFRSSLRAQ